MSFRTEQGFIVYSLTLPAKALSSEVSIIRFHTPLRAFACPTLPQISTGKYTLLFHCWFVKTPRFTKLEKQCEVAYYFLSRLLIYYTLSEPTDIMQ